MYYLDAEYNLSVIQAPMLSGKPELVWGIANNENTA